MHVCACMYLEKVPTTRSLQDMLKNVYCCVPPVQYLVRTMVGKSRRMAGFGVVLGHGGTVTEAYSGQCFDVGRRNTNSALLMQLVCTCASVSNRLHTPFNYLKRQVGGKCIACKQEPNEV